MDKILKTHHVKVILYCVSCGGWDSNPRFLTYEDSDLAAGLPRIITRLYFINLQYELLNCCKSLFIYKLLNTFSFYRGLGLSLITARLHLITRE